MKSVSSQQNKKIHNINKIIKGKNFSNLLNQYINYSIYKKNKNKTKNNKIEENKENKEKVNDELLPIKFIINCLLPKYIILLDSIKKEKNYDKIEFVQITSTVN